MKKEVFIQNLKCGGCQKTITNELGKLEGVSNISIDEKDS
jgi:copper chaperone